MIFSSFTSSQPARFLTTALTSVDEDWASLWSCGFTGWSDIFQFGCTTLRSSASASCSSFSSGTDYLCSCCDNSAHPPFKMVIELSSFEFCFFKVLECIALPIMRRSSSSNRFVVFCNIVSFPVALDGAGDARGLTFFGV